MYGMGVGKLSQSSWISTEEAKELLDSHQTERTIRETIGGCWQVKEPRSMVRLELSLGVSVGSIYGSPRGLLGTIKPFLPFLRKLRKRIR